MEGGREEGRPGFAQGNDEALDSQTQKVLSGVGDEGNEGANPLRDDKFRAFILDGLERWHVPGVAVAVVDGERTWAEGYGMASFPETPVTPDTLFYTGSTTKAFTAAIVSLLIASGNHTIPSPSFPFPSTSPPSSSSSSAQPPFTTPLSWRTPLSHLLRDDFVLAPGHEWANAHLTLEDALSHRTGFPRHDKALAHPTHPGPLAGVREVTRSLRFLPPVAEPRVAWRYCNLMFMVVSHAVQTLTGEALGVALRREIWGPLGMRATFLGLGDALGGGGGVGELAAGYYWDYEGERGVRGGDKGGEDRDERKGRGGGFTKVPPVDLDVASGAGGVISNVRDYARWIRCLVREDAPLTKEGHWELKAARVVLPPESRAGFDAPLAYSLGWKLGTYKGHRVFMHGGGMETHGAEVYFFPDLEYGVVALANTAVTSNFLGRELAWKLIDDRLGVPEGERFDWAGRARQSLERKLAEPNTAVQELYPDRADPPLPRRLPLEDYLGTYFHPAYRNVKIELINTGGQKDGSGKATSPPKPELKAIRSDFEWQMIFKFQHVSGEFWAVIIDMLNTPNRLNGQLARAEFKIGVRGKVDALEMEFLEDGSEGFILFEKIA
ncbi:beta-lactamase/transpeptidase-like protein [Whalleya microplaca]|nr:beta-lactamase/transpeptidase-like protein [Whalleya microplaca]